ncbi:FAD-dependent oxidoreductase [Bacillota bacterium Meth-B3]
METFAYKKEVPVSGRYDVLVAGGGPSGVCAAVAAAREGAKVALIERYGILGGMLTSGHVGPILGSVSKGTMRDELLGYLGVPGNDMLGEVGVVHDPERAKRALSEFVNHENIDVYLQTAVVDVVRLGNAIVGLVLSSKEGLFALHGRVTVDATGDGDVAFFSGAPCEKGREEDGLMQPVTLEFTVDGVDESRGIVCIGDVDDVQLNGERFLDFCKRYGDKGILPKNIVAVRLHRTVAPGERRVNTTQVNGVDATKVSHLYPAELELRRQVDLLVDFFREHLPGYENCRTISSATTLGVRETRRVLGEYVVSAEEMAAGARFPDAILHKVEFIVDIHNPAGAGQAEPKIQYVKPYDLPYRCFVPRGVENLLMAGRAISGTHRAHASYRVMSICMAIGQAVGVAAALCAREDVVPRALPPKAVQDALTRLNVDLFSQ